MQARLRDVLKKTRKRLESEDARDKEKDQGVTNDREIDRNIDRKLGPSY